MTPPQRLLEVCCLVDDELQARNLGRRRRRGPDPKLADREVLPRERVGPFCQRGTDPDRYRHGRRSHRAEVRARAGVHRTPFARPAANLGPVQQVIHQRLARRRAGDGPRWRADRRPSDACPFARASFCRRFAGPADYGDGHLRKRTFGGLRRHLRARRDGVLLSYRLAPARASDKAVLPARGRPVGTLGIGDRNCWSAELRDRLAAGGVRLLAPYERQSQDADRKRLARLSALRYRIETSNGQLAER